MGRVSQGRSFPNPDPSVFRNAWDVSLKLLPCSASERETEDAVMRCLEATGMRHWEALGHVTSLCSPHAARREWLQGLEGGITALGAVEALNDLAQAAPDLAHGLLQEWLRGRCLEGDLVLNGLGWVRFLPDDLQVDGDLNLVGCESLERLGAHTVVGGTLALLNCPGLRQLPVGLFVGGELDVRACRCLSKLHKDLEVRGDLRCWLGVEIPDGISVCGRIIRG